MTLPADTCILGIVAELKEQLQNGTKGEHKQQCLAVLANNLGWADLENIAGLSWDGALHDNSASLRVHPQYLQGKGQMLCFCIGGQVGNSVVTLKGPRQSMALLTPQVHQQPGHTNAEVSRSSKNSQLRPQQGWLGQAPAAPYHSRTLTFKAPHTSCDQLPAHPELPDLDALCSQVSCHLQARQHPAGRC